MLVNVYTDGDKVKVQTDISGLDSAMELVKELKEDRR